MIISDLRYLCIEDPTKYPWEDEDIVELIGMIRSAGSDDICSSGFRFIGLDLWSGIGESEDDRLRSHL